MARRRKGRAVTGILVLDKPVGPSSNGVLQRVRHLFGAAKAGHTGNLDPLASGVLPICLGRLIGPYMKVVTGQTTITTL